MKHDMRCRLRRATLFLLAPALLVPAFATGPVAQERSLSLSSFQPITRQDLATLPSGCSFSAMRGKQLLAISVGEAGSPAPKKGGQMFWFKIDGKLVQVRGKAKSGDPLRPVEWSGALRGYALRVIEGKRDPNFRNDGGGVAGAGLIEWNSSADGGWMRIRWESGC